MKSEEEGEAGSANDQGLQEAGAAAGVAKDWFDVLATMKLDEAAHVAGDESFNKDEGWADFLSTLQQSDGEEDSWGLVPTVDALDVNRYTGRWFQVREE